MIAGSRTGFEEIVGLEVLCVRDAELSGRANKGIDVLALRKGSRRVAATHANKS
jgi:hypothetical protein